MQKKLLFLCFLTAAVAGAGEVCNDNVCNLPGAIQDAGTNFKVLSPVGASSVKAIKQAPRLKTLKGKTIAIVGGSFMAHVTHVELKRLILKDHPTAKILLLNEIGSAGPYPAPGVVRKQKDDFVAKLKKHKVDAVISGNGGCGLCTPKEMGSCIAAEYAQIPSVMIAAPSFAVQSRMTAVNAGVMMPRVAVYPGAFSAHTRDELIKNTRKVLYPAIVKALTGDFTDEEKQAAQKPKSAETIFNGSLDEVNHFFNENNWSDGLPIVPPTTERVAEFLKFTDLPPDTVVATIPPAHRKVTVKTVAVNGVMAGCPAEFMPLLIAFTQAMTNGDFRRTLASTHAWTPYCWINGPVARQLGFDHAQGMISAQVNVKLGRFINLAMLNLGGYYIKANRMGTFGYLMPWSMAEDEKATLDMKYLPYHMQMGYQINDNTLTAASSLNWGNNLAPATSDPVKIMELIAADAVEKQQFALGSGTPFVYRTILITSQVAKDLAKKYKTKNALEDALIANARMPLYERAYFNFHANPGSAQTRKNSSVQRHSYRIANTEKSSTTALPGHLAWSNKKSLETVPVMKLGKTAILITGDESRNKSMCVPGGGMTTIKIELPKNWNKLMQAKGYEPLEKFYLKSDLTPEKNPRKFSNYQQRRRGQGENRRYRKQYRQ